MVGDGRRLKGGGYLRSDRGYRRSIGREEGEPDVTDVEADVLRYGVVFVDLDGFSDASWVSCLDRVTSSAAFESTCEMCEC